MAEAIFKEMIDTCSCCEGLTPETPVRITNRPGLSAIAYRTGAYASFRKSLLARLSASGIPALQKLTTRNEDDFTIALLDAWSMMADVLTFYQERIANESYIDTLTERESLTGLARLVGYELRPGVAASTSLAFTLEDAPGQLLMERAAREAVRTALVTIPAGTKVQSIPGPGETARIFETIAPIDARPQWNAIRPLSSLTRQTLQTTRVLFLQGASGMVKTGDTVLLKETRTLAKILKTETDPAKGITAISLNRYATVPTYSEMIPVANGRIGDFSVKMKLSETIIQQLASKTWQEEELAALLKIQDWPEQEVSDGFAAFNSTPGSGDQILVFRKKASIFGYNAPKQVTYDGLVPNPPTKWDEWPRDENQRALFLDRDYEEIVAGSYVAVQKPDDEIQDASLFQVKSAEIRPCTKYGISGKSTEIRIDPATQWWETGISGLSSVRSLTVHCQSEPLRLASVPLADEVGGDCITLDKYYPGLKKGSAVVLSGERSDLPGTFSREIIHLGEVMVANGLSVLVPQMPLQNRYVRHSVTINANVAPATDGETVREILGSGDATATHQHFILRHAPLTCISSDSPSGSASTLEVRVNDVLWHEVPSFLGRGGEEHLFITRQDAGGLTHVIFGDGKNGARLPSGHDNVSATYRKGTGSGGLLKASQLTQLLSRPLGVRSVINPLATAGAQDPETMGDASKNASLTIRTLDRIVSLRDYQDFAGAFAGIGKALATWSLSGMKKCIYLTVAGSHGAPVEKESTLYRNLVSAIARRGMPGTPVTVVTYRSAFFKVTAQIRIHPDYQEEKVFRLIREELVNAFSFANRNFGQPVTYSEVVTVMQKVEGVLGVDIDLLYRSDEVPGLYHLIEAKIPEPGSKVTFPAELLLIDSGSVLLKLMS